MEPILAGNVSEAATGQQDAFGMDDPEVRWKQEGGETRLVYLGKPLLKYVPDGPGFRVTTRCYIDGYQQSRLLATQGVVRRYAEAWMEKWGERAKSEIRNKVLPAPPPAKGDALGRPYPQISVKPRKVRKRR